MLSLLGQLLRLSYCNFYSYIMLYRGVVGPITISHPGAHSESIRPSGVGKTDLHSDRELIRRYPCTKSLVYSKESLVQL